MRRIRKRVTAFILVVIMLFTTGCSSGFYADELPDNMTDVSGNDNSISGNDTSEIVREVDEISEEMENGEWWDGEDTDYLNSIPLGKDQVHLTDSSNFFEWLNIYINEGTNWGLSLPDEWWDNLTDEEYAMADSLIYDMEDLSDEVYDGQSLNDCIEIIESGVDEDEFFEGTYYEGLSQEDLVELQSEGYSLDDIDNIWQEMATGYSEEDYDKNIEEIAMNTSFFSELSDKVQARESIEFDVWNGTHAKAKAVNTGYKTNTGTTVWGCALGTDHTPAICINHGMSCRTGYGYECIDKTTLYGPELGCLIGMLGSILRDGSYESNVYEVACIQIVAWMYLGQLHGQPGGSTLNYTRDQVYSILLNNFSSSAADDLVTGVWRDYQIAKSTAANGYNYEFYVWKSNNANAQTLITCNLPGEPDVLTNVQSYAHIGHANGTNQIEKSAGKISQIVDVIEYRDMGLMMAMYKGWLVKKSTGEIIARTEVPVNIFGDGSFEVGFQNIDISGMNDGEILVSCGSFNHVVTGEVILSHEDLNDSNQYIYIGDGPHPSGPPTIETGDLMGYHAAETTLTTTFKVNKRDIETGKPLENVVFKATEGIGGTYKTDAGGNFEIEVKKHLIGYGYWYVNKGDHEVKVGEDSHGHDIKETKYYYTCKDCGQSGDYDNESARDDAGIKHCENHSKTIAEADLNRQVAEYKLPWTITETSPRTSTHTYNLVTGGTDSYTTGYHNNPVITQSNTESGYHRDEHRVINVNLTNERVRGTITINKSDMDYLNCRTEGDNNQDFIPQGDASLAGAVYGLYANADIIRPDGKSGDRTGLPTNIRMDYCTGSVDDPSAHKTYTGKNPFGIDAIHTTTPLDVPVHQVSYNYSDGCVYHKGDLVAVGMFDMNLIKGTFQ